VVGATPTVENVALPGRAGDGARGQPLAWRGVSPQYKAVHSHPGAAEPPARFVLLPIFLIVLVDVLGLTIVLPLLPLYAESFGASAFVAALLVPAYAGCQMISGPILGALSDRVGRRRVLLLSQSGTLLGFLMIASAPALWLVFAGRILDGLTAGNLTVAQAYIADRTAPENRARSFALIGIAFGLGFMVGPALGGNLSHYGMSVPLYAAAGLSLLSILCTATLLPRETRAPAPHASDAPASAPPAGRRLSLLDFGQYAEYFRRPVVNGLLLEFFFYWFAFSMFMSGFALFAERRYAIGGNHFTAKEIGWVFALAGLVGVLVQGGLLGRLVKHFGEKRLIQVGLLALGIGYSTLASVEPWLSLSSAVVVAAFGNSLLRPNMTSLLTQIVDKKEQGLVLGLTQSLASLANIAAAPLSGWLIGRAHLQAWSFVAGSVCGLSLVASRWGSAATKVSHAPVTARDVRS
jgi:MFS family permease